MKVFSSLAAVMALWLAVSFLLWLLYRLFRHRDGSKQMRLLEGAVALIDEGASIFAALRVPGLRQGNGLRHLQAEPAN